MGKITLGYDNLVDDPAVVITSSTEAGADFLKGNVRVPDLGDVFRTTVLNPGWIKFTGLKRDYRLLALLGTSLTKHRNQIKHANNLDNAVWVGTGMTSVLQPQNVGEDPYGGRRGWRLTENTANSAHQIQQSQTLKEPITDEHAYTVYFRKDAVGARNLWIYFDYTGGGGDSSQAVVRVTDGAVLSGSATVTEVVAPTTGAVWYKVTTKAASNSPDNANLRVRIGLANGTATTYTGTSATLDVYAAQFESQKGANFSGRDTGSPPALNGADTGALLEINNSAGNLLVSPWQQHPFAQDAQSRATTDFYYLSSVGFDNADGTVEFRMHDDDNADSAIDVGRAWVSPIWQPSNHNLDSWGATLERAGAKIARTHGSDYKVATKGVPRRWRIGIPHVTKAEAMADLEDLAIKTHELSKPVVVIIDPDEATHKQQQLLYGHIERLSVDWAYNTAAQTHFFNLAIELEEFRS